METQSPAASGRLPSILGMRAFIGSEAIASGELTRGQLRWNYTALFPNVYVAKERQRSIWTNAQAAWLWTRRKGIIAGRAAAAMHGVHWIDDSTPIEMIADHGRTPAGIVVREERIGDDEVQTIAGIQVTTAARTALDLARHLPRDVAVAHLDGLAAVTGIGHADVDALVDRYRGARGIPHAHVALHLMDGGTRRPEESRIRLRLHDAGVPRPRTSIVLRDGDDAVTIGMGWDGPRVGVSFWDVDNQSDPCLMVQEIRHHDLVQRLGWHEIRVAPAAAHSGGSVVFRVRRAFRERAG